MNITRQQHSLAIKQVVQRAESAPSPAEDRQRPPTILLVDDEDPLREVAKKILRSRGYTVLEAKDGNTCLKIAQEYPCPIHLLVTDMFMPQMNGREVAERLAAQRPDLKVLYMSGYTDDALLRRGLMPPGVSFIQRPFRPMHWPGRCVRSSMLAKGGRAQSPCRTARS
jgi:two-component system cell cycle sensor histidine kinase/response regulator CckA